jgi:hypothetical protein
MSIELDTLICICDLLGQEVPEQIEPRHAVALLQMRLDFVYELAQRVVALELRRSIPLPPSPLVFVE